MATPTIALVNPNTDRAATAMMVTIAQEHAAGRATVEGFTAAAGVPLIADDEGLALAARMVRSLVPHLARFDGVIVSAFGDPGAGELRGALTMPVVGIAEAAMAAAAEIGPFAIATTTPGLAAHLIGLAAAYGHGEALVGIKLTEGDPAALAAQPDALAAALGAEVRAAAAEGAKTVVIGGGPLAGAARTLRSTSPVPIIEPIPAAVDAILKMFDI